MKKRLIVSLVACIVACALALSGCVDQHPERHGDKGASDVRLIATSPAIVTICDKLDLNLVGVPQTARALPERYADATVVGPPMGPDVEVLSSLHADCILSPNSLVNDLQPKYASVGTHSLFLDMRSVDGMYDSIEVLGSRFDREEQAQALVAEYEDFMASYRESVAGLEAPRVLILMGVPGSYLVATENSYAGSLVAQAGGVNVYGGTDQEFLNANTEDMLARDPDIILRTAHALPDQVMSMFADEFAANDIWKHFRAVREGRVYDLPYDHFGMSATFNYPDALEDLRPLLYGDRWSAGA